MKHLCELGEELKSWADIINELQDYLEKLNDKLADEVKKYLEEMYNNGKLQEIISEILTPWLNEQIEFLKKAPTKTQVLDMTRHGRILKKSVDRTDSFNGNEPTIDSEYYSYCQGATVFIKDSVKYLACCFVCSNYGHYQWNNVARLIVYDYNTLQEVKNISLVAGHANAIAYNNEDNSLYICWSSEYDANGVASNVKNITRISFDSFSNPETITLNIGVNFSTIACYNGDIYIGSRFNVYKVDWETRTATPYIIPDISNKSGLSNIRYFQGMAVTKDYVYYMCSQPECVARFNIVTNTIDWVYEIPTALNYGFYKTGECEGIGAFDNGDLYVITTQHINPKELNQFDITQIFEQNLIENIIQPPLRRSYDRSRTPIYVDGYNATGINPDGSSTNPFFLIGEALQYINQYPYSSTFRIIVRSHAREYVYINTSHNITIQTASSSEGVDTIHTQLTGTIRKSRIGGILLDGGHLYMNNVVLNMSLCPDTAYGNVGTNLQSDAPSRYFWGRNGTFALHNISINEYMSGFPTPKLNDFTTECYYCRGCKGDISNEVGRSQTDFEALGSKFIYVDAGDSTINVHFETTANKHYDTNGIPYEAGQGNLVNRKTN